MLKRIFDIVGSFIGLIILFPVFIIVAVLIAVNSKGGIFYTQLRVGKNGKDFKLLKFRSMYPDSETRGLLTVGGCDPRITPVGNFLRKYKLDELPQLFNVLIGDMSLVGPRPEVRKYVALYNSEQLHVLSVRPGLTDYASLEYFNENDLLGASADPEKTYIEEVMPAKLKLNHRYIAEAGLRADLKIIFKTVARILKVS